MTSTPTERSAVVFDLDGTLVDSRIAVVEAVATGVREVARQHGHGEVDIDAATIRDALGQPADEYFRNILPDNLRHLADEVKRASTEHEVAALAGGGGRLFDGVLDTLDTLRRHGLLLATISNAQAPYFHAALDHLDLRSRMDHTECYEELEATAQPPYKNLMLRRALEVLGVAPERAVMVGDRSEDLAAGRALGCVSIGTLEGFGSRTELSGGHDVIERFTDLWATVRRHLQDEFEGL